MTQSSHAKSVKESGSFFGGLMLGGLLGGAFALLYAPNSGEHMRGIITKAGEDVLERGQKIVEEARQQAEAIIADAQRRAERIAETARGNANDLSGDD